MTMHLRLQLAIATALFLICTTTHAQITWDGGGGNSFWGTANNWNPNGVPTSGDNVVVDVNTNLRGSDDFILDFLNSQGSSQFASLTIDPQWVSPAAGKFSIRGDGVVDMFGDVTFTSNFTDNSSLTFAGNTGGPLRVRSRGNHTIFNDSATEVTFGPGGASNGVTFIGLGSGNQTLNFGGTGDFSLGANLAVAANLERIWTEDTYSGTVTVNGNTNSWFDPAIDIRAQGGTIDFEANHQIGDSTAVAFNDGDGNGAVMDFSGVTDDIGTLAVFGDHGGTLIVDELTNLIADDFRDRSDGDPLEILGWVEGSSSLIFTELGSPPTGSAYSGMIAEGALINDLLVNGNPAIWTQVADVNNDNIADWAIVSTPEPTSASIWALAAVLCTGLYIARRRRVQNRR